MEKAALRIDLGHASLAGLRPANEDYCAGVTPDGEALGNKGALVGIADGLGGHAHGREAAEYAVRSVLSDYYSTPDTLSIAQSLEKVMVAVNRWLHAHSRKARETAGMATTLSAVAFRGRRYTIAHVGDTRIYRLRGKELSLLTEDHVWAHPEFDNVLSRAVGLDANISIDFIDGELEAGDVFLLATDGVWNALDDKDLIRLLGCPDVLEDVASRITLAAIHAGSTDNCTALIVRILSLPAESLRDNLASVAELPLPPRLKPGQCVDGLEVLDVIHDSRNAILYLVRDPATDQRCVLKTLHADASDIAAIAREEWLARRVVSAYFPQALNRRQRTFLYYLMSWHEGATLARHLEMGRRFTPIEAADLAGRMLKALKVLHRMGIVHRDIKPDNLHLGADGQLRLLDLGVAASRGFDEQEISGETGNPGTPSFMAPELYRGVAASESSDLYAAGVTVYHLLTRKYPYGEIEPFQNPRFGDPVPPVRYRPDIPEWLESVMLKAVALDPQERFETAEEFLLALERGAQRPLFVARNTPLFRRDPVLGLKMLAMASIFANILLLLLYLAKK